MSGMFFRWKGAAARAMVAMGAMAAPMLAAAQDGNTGITQANTLIRGYFTNATDLMYAVAAILGLIGGVKVYQRIQGGHHESWQSLAAWFGACIFLVIVSTVIRSFFGL